MASLSQAVYTERRERLELHRAILLLCASKLRVRALQLNLHQMVTAEFLIGRQTTPSRAIGASIFIFVNVLAWDARCVCAVHVRIYEYSSIPDTGERAPSLERDLYRSSNYCDTPENFFSRTKINTPRTVARSLIVIRLGRKTKEKRQNVTARDKSAKIRSPDLFLGSYSSDGITLVVTLERKQSIRKRENLIKAKFW